MSKEKRVFSRIRLPSEASVVFKQKAYPVKLENISLQGATVTTDAKISLVKGNACLLRINTQGNNGSMELEALAMYSDESSIGFQFSENRQSTVRQLHRLISANFEKTE